MNYTFRTHGTCSTQITFDVEHDTIKNIRFRGGCDGNLKAIPRLVDGWSAQEIADRLKGISCDGKPTSCADQLAQAVLEATGKKG